MYFDQIFEANPTQATAVTLDDEELQFVSIFKADSDEDSTEDTSESLDGDDGSSNSEGNDDSSTDSDSGSGSSGDSKETDNSSESETADDTAQSSDNADDSDGSSDSDSDDTDSSTDESLDEAAKRNEDTADSTADNSGSKDEVKDDAKLVEINERLACFRNHRKLFKTVTSLQGIADVLISKSIDSDNRKIIIRIQRDLMVTGGQLEYAMMQDWETLNLQKATSLLRAIEQKIILMSETLKKIRKEDT